MIAPFVFAAALLPLAPLYSESDYGCLESIWVLKVQEPMKRGQESKRWQPYELPCESELQEVRLQRYLAYFSSGCVVLMAICVYLWHRGLPMIPVAGTIFALLCTSVAVHLISVFRNGFFARGSYVARGCYGISLGIIRVGGILIVGMFFLWLMSN